MAEKVNSKRAKFPRGLQRRFIQKVLTSLSLKKVAGLCGVSQRTIRDWHREKFLISEKALRLLTHKTGIAPGVVRFLPQYWYAAKGAKKGWAIVKEKYGRVPGNEALRQRRWREWWEREGRSKMHPIINVSKPIRKPAFSKELAEFVGIVLGDGGMTKYQIVITLHRTDDKEYSQYVASLIAKLFRVPVHFSYRSGIEVVLLVVSRSALIRYCVEQLGMTIGNKVRQQTGVPLWIQKNPRFRVACARGLLDTDGSLFRHRYSVNGKMYSYHKFDFTNRSKPLIDFVFSVFQELGLNPRRTKDKYSVRLDSQKSVALCFERIKPSNPKYLKRYQN